MKKRDIDCFIDNLCVKYAATHPFPKYNIEWLNGMVDICS